MPLDNDTKEKIDLRIKALEIQRARLFAQVAAADGAIRELKHLLGEGEERPNEDDIPKAA